MLSGLLLATGWAPPGGSKFNGDNMNGEYLLSRTPHAPAGRSFTTRFRDFPGGVESFEVYHGPITSRYSEVFWTSISNDLPPEIVRRFDGKVMAIVGVEMDQVRRTADGDVPVPITVAYNHHHDTAVVGSGTRLEVVGMDDERVARAGRDFIRLSGRRAWLPVEHTPSARGYPTSALFSDGNGGEYRKTFHALAPPYAQLVESPRVLSGSPMQIDTWNREAMNLTRGRFVAGPYPRSNLAPTEGPDAVYSGLLECPLTTRVRKDFEGGGSFNDTHSAALFACAARDKPHACALAARSADECFAAARELPRLAHARLATETIHDARVPAGCTVSMGAAGAAVARYNTNADALACCGGASEIWGDVASLVSLSVRLSRANGTATLELRGPADVWFGVGLNASMMADQPYAIIVEGGTGRVSERRLADHAAGAALSPSVAVVSSALVDGVRTVVLARPLVGATADHYSFDADALRVDIINAVGSGPTVEAPHYPHKQKTAATLHLWPTDGTAVCVCTQPALPFGKEHGLLRYEPTGEAIGFGADRCAPAPRESLLDSRNPTCDMRTYAGGLSACHHGWSLLDADQEIPWADQPLEYYKKFRIYFQELNASFHRQIYRQDWGIGADQDYAEYDVMQCGPGTPVGQCTQTIEGTWMPVPSSQPNVYLVKAHFHCHAPTCLKMEMWNNDTGALLCRQEPVYGGTGVIDRADYDEERYIATPPCMWGSAEHGLEPPPLVSGMTIRAVSVTNSTYGHHGEMALPEVSLVQI